MSLTPGARAMLLSRWVQPSSDHEKAQQDRAERMVREAISASPAFSNSEVSIYTKGSYPNNTNVRRDSDVDVVVELQDCQYYDYLPGVSPAASYASAYPGPWTPQSWRSAVTKALEERFGTSSVAPGKIAINVKAVEGSRPSADVVPSFNYVRYDDPNQESSHVGSCVFPSDGGPKVVNYPRQQLENGRWLNTLTGQRYKKFVRALKNAENTLVANGEMEDLPSYFMECLVYNVPPTVLRQGDNLDDGFAATLAHLWRELSGGDAERNYHEPNELKWLFKGQASKWTVEDGRRLVIGTWNHLGYGG